MTDGAAENPKVRDLTKIIEALEIVESEFGFQVMRLDEHVRPRTGEEQRYHEELREGYQTAQRYSRILRKYHQGRLERKLATGSTAVETEMDSGIDDLGRAAAFTEDESI